MVKVKNKPKKQQPKKNRPKGALSEIKYQQNRTKVVIARYKTYLGWDGIDVENYILMYNHKNKKKVPISDFKRKKDVYGKKKNEKKKNENSQKVMKIQVTGQESRIVTRRRNRRDENSWLKRVRTKSLKNKKRVQREKGKVQGKVEKIIR